MTSYLLFAAIALIVVAIPIAVIILLRRRTANFQKIWDFALEGDLLARIYMGLVAGAFICAVIGALLARK